MEGALDKPALAPCVALHCQLGFEALEVAKDRGDGERAPTEPEAQKAILGRDVPVDCQIVPFLGVPDIVDGDVVVLAPEERDGRKCLTPAEHVESGRLSLALVDHPMLDAN